MVLEYETVLIITYMSNKSQKYNLSTNQNQ